MTVSWTLEGELAKLARTDEIASALAILGIAESDEELALDTVRDWYRYGSKSGLLSEVLDNVDRAGIDLSPTELMVGR